MPIKSKKVLKDFAEKSFIEQISVLNEVRDSKKAESLADLFELYANPLNDPAVDSMVHHTLSDLLDLHKKEVIAGLSNKSFLVRTLCIRKVGKCRDESAVPLLVDMLKDCDNVELISEILNSLQRFDTPELVNVFRSYLDHSDYRVLIPVINKIADIGEKEDCAVLIKLLSSQEDFKTDIGEECSLITGFTLSNLVKFVDNDVIDFFVTHIHHSNAAIRRLIHDGLVSFGSIALPALKRCIESGNKDEKILTSNVLGFIGDKKGADIIIENIEKKESTDVNVTFAMYEALGKIDSIRSVVCLLDGLKRKSDFFIAAVVVALDNLYYDGVLKVVNELLNKKNSHANRILETIVKTRARNLFAALYSEDVYAEFLVEKVVASKDKKTVKFFRDLLCDIKTDRSDADVKRLDIAEKDIKFKKRVLAADDSSAMLFLYEEIGAELGVELLTFKNGKEALGYFETGEPVDLLITDMNMPVMDGVELIREVKKVYDTLPVIMITTESERSQSENALKAGVNYFLTKPFRSDSLKEMIQGILG